MKGGSSIPCLLAYVLLALLLFVQSSAATTEYGTKNYTKFIHGDLPIILTAPHGGSQTDPGIPDRNCTGCTTVRDSYTIELTTSLSDSLFAVTGKRPHVIILYLARTKLDVNREIDEAAQGNPLAEQVYHEFHTFVEKARNMTTEAHGEGLLIDIHGQGHSEMWVELGYLLSDSQLDESDDDLQELEDETSIYSLSKKHPDQLAEMIRGPDSIGAQLETLGYPSVPSPENPGPGAGNYFSGGYITDVHGSRTRGEIDAIQIESPRDVRFEENGRDREEYAAALADSILHFMDKYYPALRLRAPALLAQKLR